MPLYQVAKAAHPGLWIHNQFFQPGDLVLIAPADYASQLPRWSAAGVTPGAKGYIAPKLLSTDAAGAADLAANAAVLGGQAAEATTTDSMYPLGNIGGG